MIYLSIQVSSWIAFAVVANGAWSACAFASVGAIVMSSWALQRHEKYVAADSADYPRHARTPIVPGLNVPLPRALTDALAEAEKFVCDWIRGNLAEITVADLQGRRPSGRTRGELC